MHVVFWQNIISPHQAGFMRGLADRGHHVTVVAAQRMSESRRRLGWQPPDLEPARVIIGPSSATVREVIRDQPEDAIHCIAGARVVKLGAVVTRECVVARRRMGIIAETPDPRGPGGWLRWGKYTAERFLRGRHFDFVLAMGETGVRWFRGCGYPASHVFPFAYVTEMEPRSPEEEVAGRFRVLFVGRLVDLKGVDVLLKAIARTADVDLEIIGDGSLRDTLTNLAGTLGIGSRVRWQGQLNTDDVATRLARADVLALPSRKDGWGAVVNEALMLGTPVICSAACGASDLLRHDWLGTVVPADDVAALHDALKAWAAQGRRTASQRQRVREWSRCIQGDAVAAYLEAVLRHVYDGWERPIAPWRARA